MNELFGALGALTRKKLQPDLLETWARTRLTVILVSHAVLDAVQMADRVVVVVVVVTAGPGRAALRWCA